MATVHVKNKADVAKKTAFKLELLEKFNINIDNIPFMDKELAMVCALKLVFLKVSPEGWSESRNSLLTCVVNPISNEST